MKNTLSLSLLAALFLVPAQLGATVVRASIWQRPNGTHIVIIGDASDASHAEKKQATDCIKYLQNQNNIHLIAFPMTDTLATASNFSLMMGQFFNITGADVEVRYLFGPGDLADATIQCHACADKILNEAGLKEHIIPAPLKAEFKKLQSAIANCSPVLPHSFHLAMMESTCEDCCGVDAIEARKNAILFFENYAHLHYHLLASRLTEPSVAHKDTYVYLYDSNYAQDSTFKLFEDLMAKVGYTQIATHSSSIRNPLNLKNILASVTK
jgi:hypothetical protein